MEYVRTLSGHSGCRLELYKEGNTFFLRKGAGAITYNGRLKRQCAKQKSFRLEGIKTPAVLRYGYDEAGVFYFDMEFVNGITLAEYMNRIKIKEIVDLMALLFRSLPIEQSMHSELANTIFQNKIQSVLKECPIKNPFIEKAVAKLVSFDFSNVPLSPCCGDLTLENIILSSSGIYVIDLLDSFYNSWMIDVAKVLQDIDVGWSYRHQKRDFNLNLRLSTAKQALWEQLQTLPEASQKLITIYHILLLNVLRIYPYARDEETMRFLDHATDLVLTTIRTMEVK